MTSTTTFNTNLTSELLDAKDDSPSNQHFNALTEGEASQESGGDGLSPKTTMRSSGGSPTNDHGTNTTNNIVRGQEPENADLDIDTYTDAQGRVQRLQSPLTIDWQHTRTSLANERTFLAWMRTSLSIFSFGWAILKVQQFFQNSQLHWYDELVGYIFCLGGVASFAIGTQRYLRVRSAMAFPESVVRFGRIGIRYIIGLLSVCFFAALLRLTVNDIQSHLHTSPAIADTEL